MFTSPSWEMWGSSFGMATLDGAFSSVHWRMRFDETNFPMEIRLHRFSRSFSLRPSFGGSVYLHNPHFSISSKKLKPTFCLLAENFDWPSHGWQLITSAYGAAGPFMMTVFQRKTGTLTLNLALGAGKGLCSWTISYSGTGSFRDEFELSFITRRTTSSMAAINSSPDHPLVIEVAFISIVNVTRAKAGEMESANPSKLVTLSFSTCVVTSALQCRAISVGHDSTLASSFLHLFSALSTTLATLRFCAGVKLARPLACR
mmetsp:Transcript_13583/g.29830  ORF Transcript_13583/g.29830 Transcript_13583/m.29830 type:complete len:259 (+) Transcript_13583:484-1260(+)